jgi:hypothetical protein
VSDVLDEGPFFHGTKADPRVGDLLTAGFRSNYRPEVVMNHIYFTALLDGAGLAAELAVATRDVVDGRAWRLDRGRDLRQEWRYLTSLLVPEVPVSHANARLNVFGRRTLVERVLAGHKPGEVAKQLNVSRSTVYKEARELSTLLGVPASTIGAVLRRAQVPHLAQLDRLTGQLVRGRRHSEIRY